MLFVEALRIAFVLVGVLIGVLITGGAHHSADERFVGAAIGALIGYVVGGLIGRFLQRGMGAATTRLSDVPPTEVLAGTMFACLGAIIGVLLCLPLFAFAYSVVLWPITAVVALTLAEFGRRVGMAKAGQLSDAFGLTRRLSVRQASIPAGGLVIDSSALMDRSLLPLGRAGLLPHHLLVPQFVMDTVMTIADGPDQVAARRARGGMETLERLRQLGFDVAVVPGSAVGPDDEDELAELDAIALEMGARVATCSSTVAVHREESGAPVLDLRKLAGDLGPDRVPGEMITVDLIRAGRQPRQAVGYLPNGDMVVVNDADQLIGTHRVEVEVLSTRHTSQGLLVFARLLAGAGRAG
jgi:uncharacterized protein YacL